LLIVEYCQPIAELVHEYLFSKLIVMRKNFLLLMTFLSLNLYAQQDNAPVVGVSDKRIEIYGLKNARVVVDYQSTIENTDILVSDGRIERIGQGLVFPKGTIIYDLKGKTVYPSFIDIKHYEMAPANLSFLSKAGIVFAVTSSGLEHRSDFLTNLRKAIKYGLPENEALKALTYTPASMIGASDMIGAIKEKMIANFLIYLREYF